MTTPVDVPSIDEGDRIDAAIELWCGDDLSLILSLAQSAEDAIAGVRSTDGHRLNDIPDLAIADRLCRKIYGP